MANEEKAQDEVKETTDGQEPNTESQEPEPEFLSWNKDRQQDDQNKANIKKLSQDLGEANAELADLKARNEAQAQKDAEADSAADLQVGEFTTDEEVLKALTAVTGQIKEARASATEANRVAAETSAQVKADRDARASADAEAQVEAGTKALKRRIAELSEQYGGHLASAACEAADAALRAKGYGEGAPAPLDSADFALENAFLQEQWKEAAGLRDKPKVDVDSGAGGSAGTPLKEGSLEEVRAEMISSGKISA